MQKIVRCKSCLTTSTGYRGEACIKTNPRGNSDRYAVCSFLSGQSRTSKGKSLCVRLRSETKWPEQGHIISSPPGKAKAKKSIFCFLTIRHYINLLIFYFFKKERKEWQKKGERVERERGKKMSFFSLQRTHNARAFFSWLCPSLPDKNISETTK